MPKKENIEALFDNIAPSYDKLNHILSFGVDYMWRRRSVREILDARGGQRGLNILDVACGTGDFAIAIAKKAGADIDITGVDISEGMMSLGRQKISALGLKINLEQGDCEALEYNDGSFDCVTVAFGVRNFEHIDVGLSEMHRVLAAGGKMVILELSIPRNKFAAGLYRVYFEHILPWIGKRVSGDKSAYKYLPASVLNFPTPEKFCEMLCEAGFTDVRHKSLSLGICQMYIGYKR